MFSRQNITMESTMNNFTENWCCGRDQKTTNYQIRPNVKTAESYTDESIHVDQKLHFAANHIENDSYHQYTPLVHEPAQCPVFHLSKPYQSNILMKKHRAQISFVPTRSGNFKAIVKRKRKRTVFTTEQIEALEVIFKRKQYITREDRARIVNELQINDKAVKIWFQNRRLKVKKCPEKIEEAYETTSSVGERSSPDLARLDFVESRIKEKTDEFGYVTLDDGIMKELFNVIDDFLGNNRSNVMEDIKESDSSPIYEPISPASASDSNDEDNASCWKPSEPNESLQRLFDLQTMFSS